VPIAMSIPDETDQQDQLTFKNGIRKWYKPEKPDQVFFLAITPSDRTKMKESPIVMSLDGSDFTLKPVARTTKSDAGAVSARKPEEIAADIRQQLADYLRQHENKRIYDLPDGGYIFAGPAARLLADALAKQDLVFWNLSLKPNAVDILIGIREADPPKPTAPKLAERPSEPKDESEPSKPKKS
jgi:hypothetical protein